MATASVPEFHLAGSITNLVITNDGFMVDSATLALTDEKPIKIGDVSIKNPSVTLTNFGYSLTNGASFNSTLSVAIDEADLDVGPVNVTATAINASISLMPADAGHFTFSADTVTAMLGIVPRARRDHADQLRHRAGVGGRHRAVRRPRRHAQPAPRAEGDRQRRVLRDHGRRVVRDAPRLRRHALASTTPAPWTGRRGCRSR